METLLMLLCDIGNTSFHFLDTDTDIDTKYRVGEFIPSSIKNDVYYICVEPNIKKELQGLKNWKDLSLYVDMEKYYPTMGIDRVIACEAIQEKDCVIVDAGSAITVDIIKDGTFLGGFIYPGINAMGQTYKNISLALEYPFNFEIDLTTPPKNSADAISYGFLKTLYCEVISYNIPIILTGGDAKQFSKIFTKAKIDEKLLFNGMKRLAKFFGVV